MDRLHGTAAAPGDRAAASLGVVQLVLLTLCLAGVQFAWTVELAYGTPYLLSLGLARSLTALVWLAGPLSGLIVQPLIGAYCDTSTLKLGRRRPVMLVGGLLVALSIVLIAYAREIAESMVLRLDVDEAERAASAAQAHTWTIALAVLGFYTLDFSINAVQAACRALIVDIAPLHQQDAANAWGGRMIGFGNVLGYFVGYLDLPALAPFLGTTQIKALCGVAIVWFSATLAVTCIAVRERPFVAPPSHARRSWLAPLADIVQALGSLPRPIQSVCNVQFVGWLGWFPFLFYSTSWVAEKAGPGPTDAPTDQGTRAGSFALLVFALISVATGVVLPMVAGRSRQLASQAAGGVPAPAWRRLLRLPAIWSASFWLFAVLMMATAAASDVAAATVIVGATGVSWGITQWIPFTLMGECVSVYAGGGAADEAEDADAVEDAVDEEAAAAAVAGAAGPRDRGASAGLRAAAAAARRDGYQRVHGGDASERDGGGRRARRALRAGLVLGIHNIYIVLPQFASTAACAAAFAAAGAAGGRDAFGWVLRAGALASAAAAVLAARVVEARRQ